MVPDAPGWCVEGAGESEIDDLDAVILRDQYVLRLDVAMDDAAGVGVFEGGGDFAGIAQPRALGERSGKAGAERHAFDVLHDEPGDFARSRRYRGVCRTNAIPSAESLRRKSNQLFMQRPCRSAADPPS